MAYDIHLPDGGNIDYDGYNAYGRRGSVPVSTGVLQYNVASI